MMKLRAALIGLSLLVSFLGNEAFAAAPAPPIPLNAVYSSWTQSGRMPDISVTGSSQTHAFGALGPVGVVYNTGTNYAYVQASTSVSTIITVAQGTPIPPGTCAFINTAGQAYLTAIGAGNTTLQVTLGWGNPGSCGGAGGGGGGGGNVNLNAINGVAPSTSNPLFIAPATGANMAQETGGNLANIYATLGNGGSPASNTVNSRLGLLALESGGHLASIDVHTPALGQALAAASVPVVLTAAQFSTLTPLSSVTVTQGVGTNLHMVCDSGCAVGGGGNVNITQILGAAPSLTNPLWVSPATGATFAVSAASLPLPTNAATQTTSAAILTAIGTPFQAGASIANTSFGISGTLPAFAAPPTVTLNQATLGTTNGVTPVPGGGATASAVTPIPSTVPEATHLFKGSAGNVFSIAATNLTVIPGYLVLLNLTSAPADGAITPLACAPLPAGGSASVSYGEFPARYGTGVVAVVTSAVSCFTKTTGAITAFLSGQVQ